MKMIMNGKMNMMIKVKVNHWLPYCDLLKGRTEISMENLIALSSKYDVMFRRYKDEMIENTNEMISEREAARNLYNHYISLSQSYTYAAKAAVILEETLIAKNFLLLAEINLVKAKNIRLEYGF